MSERVHESIASASRASRTADGQVRIDPTLDLALTATRDCLAVIHESVGAFLAWALGQSGDFLPEVQLALQEACSNVVRHAYASAPQPGGIQVQAELSPWLLRLTVSDEGPGYDFARIPSPDFAHPREGGFGLHLMRATMSKVTYTRRGRRNLLIMEKALPASAGTAEHEA